MNTDFLHNARIAEGLGEDPAISIRKWRAANAEADWIEARAGKLKGSDIRQIGLAFALIAWIAIIYVSYISWVHFPRADQTEESRLVTAVEYAREGR